MDEINWCFEWEKHQSYLREIFIAGLLDLQFAILYEIECVVVEGQQKRKLNIENTRKLQEWVNVHDTIWLGMKCVWDEIWLIPILEKMVEYCPYVVWACVEETFRSLIGRINRMEGKLL